MVVVTVMLWAMGAGLVGDGDVGCCATDRPQARSGR